MKGAIAVPLTRTMSPPKIASMTTIGSSQYFFRVRMNSQNSRMKSSITSELLPHRVRGGPGGIAFEPVTSRVGIAPESEQILAGQPEEDADGGHDAEEDRAHDDRSHDAVQQEPQRGPRTVEGDEDAGMHERGGDQQRSERSDVHPRRPPAHERPEGEREQDSAHYHAEPSLGRPLRGLFIGEVFVETRLESTHGAPSVGRLDGALIVGLSLVLVKRGDPFRTSRDAARSAICAGPC